MIERVGDATVKGTGKISTYFTVWCGGCSYWENDKGVANKRTFGKQLRADGWKLTRKDGWLCPDCVNKANGNGVKS